MPISRRNFFRNASLSLLGAASASRALAQTPNEPPPGMPPAFGTGPKVGPEVSPATFAEAEKLVQIELTRGARELAASSWRDNMAALYGRRAGPRKIALEPTLSPARSWNPLLPGVSAGPSRNRFIRSNAAPGPLSDNDQDIAFASVAQQSHWIQQRKLTSERLTNIYLERIERFVAWLIGVNV